MLFKEIRKDKQFKKIHARIKFFPEIHLNELNISDLNANTYYNLQNILYWNCVSMVHRNMNTGH